VVAWVVPVDPSRPPTLSSIRAFVAEALPSYAAPRDLILVAALPRSALGKLVRHRLPGYVE
jgi:acyl-coenzyme A synthetase/AMP-(fatty) acid ligase